MVYLHDGTFDGFLTCIYRYYYEDKADEIYSRESYRVDLLNEIKYIETDNDKALKVYNSITSKFSEEFYWNVFNTFLSDNYYKDCYLLKFLIMAFKIGKNIDRVFTHEHAYYVKKLSRRVSMEKHRFLGILRFMDTGKFLFSKMSPDNDILILIAEHFVDRFSNEHFVIYDEKRHKAIISAQGKWYISDIRIPETMPISKEEKQFQDLWKGYFEVIGIEGRKNSKLQQAFVPLKYRDNILEFN